MRKKLLKHLTDLVKFETVAGNDEEIKQAFAYLDQQLQAIYPFVKKKYVHNGVHSVIWATKDTLNPDIILNAHIDVVPAKMEMFNLKRVGGKLIGRGTSDMKFAIASFIHALMKLQADVGLNNTSIAVMITSDEEQGGFNGVNHLVNDIGYRSKLVIIPDAGDDWHIALAAKGASWIKLTTTGNSAHASRPWEGKSAIDQLVKILYQFRQTYKNPAETEYVTTTNIGLISGGTTANQIANTASATIDIRYTAELTVEDIISHLKDQHSDLKIEKIVDKQNFVVDKNNEYLQKWIKLANEVDSQIMVKDDIFVSENGSADHHYFTDHGIPVLATKPTGGLIHTESEWLNENDFYLFASLLAKYLRKVVEAYSPTKLH